MSEKTLVIWYKNGTTSYFENVSNFTADYILSFNYFGISSQKQRTATFNLNNIAGYALED